MENDITLNDLVFFRSIEKDNELAMKEFKSVMGNTEFTSNSVFSMSELLKDASPTEVAYIYNAKKMKKNLELVNTELPKSLALANALRRMFEVNLYLTTRDDESILLSVRASFYSKFEKMFENYPEFLEEYADLKKEIITGKKNTFSIIVTNRNFRNNYELLESVYDQTVFSFKEKVLSNMSIVLDANTIQFEEVSV